MNSLWDRNVTPAGACFSSERYAGAGATWPSTSRERVHTMV